MFYADDSDLYVAINPNNPFTSNEMLSNCINEVILWNTGNMLLCNPGKTEVLHLTSRFKKHQNLQANFSFANTIYLFSFALTKNVHNTSTTIHIHET